MRREDEGTHIDPLPLIPLHMHTTRHTPDGPLLHFLRHTALLLLPSHCTSQGSLLLLGEIGCPPSDKLALLCYWCLIAE